jgi:hypothetical protein
MQHTGKQAWELKPESAVRLKPGSNVFVPLLLRSEDIFGLDTGSST